MSLYCFLVGINGLSTAIKHMGGDFAENILTTTSNPFIALFIGILSTTIFQSSSTTTSLIVGMVSGGALNLAGAIPMIMGANIEKISHPPKKREDRWTDFLQFQGFP